MFSKEEKNNFQYLFLSSSWQVFFTSGVWEAEAGEDEWAGAVTAGGRAAAKPNQSKNCQLLVFHDETPPSWEKTVKICQLFCLTHAEFKVFSEYLSKNQKGHWYNEVNL